MFLHYRPVHRCAFMPSDNHVVSFSDDKTLIQWDLATEELIHKYEGHSVSKSYCCSVCVFYRC